MNGSLASSLRGSQFSSIYHSMDNEICGSGVGGNGQIKSTSEATTVQLNRTFINYNDTLSQSNPSSSTLTLNAANNNNSNNLKNSKNTMTLNDTRLKKIYSVTGMAPLASPESLSEMSSVSSLPTPCGDEYESQMHTPKVLRRAPKISAPLSNIDWKTIQEYEKLGQVFYTNNSSNNNKVPSEGDDLDYPSLDTINANGLHYSDSQIDHGSSGTYASAVSSLSGLNNKNDSNSKLLSKLNSVTFEEDDYYMSRVTPEGMIESHFPVFYDLNPQSTNDKQQQQQHHQNGNVRYENNNFNEALPLLANLNERTGVSFVRKKNYVYPSGTPVHQRLPSYRVTSPNTSSPRSSKSSQSLNRNESSV